jgi:hypothetical protein
VQDVLRKNAKYLLGLSAKPDHSNKLFMAFVKAGEGMLYAVRHGKTHAIASEFIDQGQSAPLGGTPSVPSPHPEVPVVGTSAGFDRSKIRSLQDADPDFTDVIKACEVRDKLYPKFVGGLDPPVGTQEVQN